MTRGRVIRMSKNFQSHDSSDEEFSSENTESSSSSEEEKKKTSKRKRRYSDSEDVDNPSSEDERKKKGKKKKKRKSKYHENSDNSESDDEDSKEKERKRRLKAQEELKKRREEEERKRQEMIKSSKLTILPLTDEQLKEQYKYRKHKCKLSEIKTKRAISGQDSCRPGRPADLAVDKVKLHYVVHYIYRGVWDDIVPEEGDREGKIDSYVCNACNNKRFKNYLEKHEYPGRGSALCHIATDHGRLLSAMLNDKEVDMSEEIRHLARYDKQFNEIYRTFLDKGDNSFVMQDDEIITTKESLVWKIYQKPKKENQNQANKITNVVTPKVETSEVSESAKAVLQRPKPKRLHCPFKEFSNCDYKGHEDGQAFRLHFFLHYKDQWNERIDSLVKGDKVYYCDICPSKKPSRGATPDGAKTAAICHLAIQHHELRGIMEKDERLSKDFINDVYYDVDLKKAQNNTGIEKKEPKDESSTPKQSITEVEKKTPKPGPKSKTRPGPKSRTKAKSPVPDEDPEDIPDLSDEEIMKPNKEYIRKRKKLVLTMEDLEPEASDEEFTASTRTPKTNQVSRKMPKRSATKKPKLESKEPSDEDLAGPKPNKSGKKTITDYYSAKNNDQPVRSSRRKNVVMTQFSDESD